MNINIISRFMDDAMRHSILYYHYEIVALLTWFCSSNEHCNHIPEHQYQTNFPFIIVMYIVS